MARRCGAKHIFKSNCPKDLIGGPIFEVPMFKNGTPLWHQAHLSVKMYKTPRARTNFGRSDVQKWHTAVVRSAFASQNVKKLRGLEQFWKLRCPKMSRSCAAERICESKRTKHAFSDHFLKFRCRKISQFES